MTKTKVPARLKRQDRIEAMAALKHSEVPGHDPGGALALLKRIHQQSGAAPIDADVARARSGLVRKQPSLYVGKAGFYVGSSPKGFPSMELPDDPRFATKPSDAALRAALRASRTQAERDGIRERGTAKGGRISASLRPGKAATILAEAAALSLAGKPSHAINGLISRKLGVSRDYVGRVRRKKPT